MKSRVDLERLSKEELVEAYLSLQARFDRPVKTSCNVRLPREFRFDGSEVFIRRDLSMGDVILSGRPPDWSDFLDALRASGPASDDFLSPSERISAPAMRDPLDDVR